MEIGQRAGALRGFQSPSDTTIGVFGYGVYEGEFPVKISAMGQEMEVPNPRILLDSGKHVYGLECWWGPEDEIKAQVAEYEANGITAEPVEPSFKPDPTVH